MFREQIKQLASESTNFCLDLSKIEASKPIFYKNVLAILSTLRKSGDSIELKSNQGPISAETWRSRNVCTSGKVSIEYPGSDEPMEWGIPGEVFPKKDEYKTDTFVWTALEDKTSSLCIHPYNGVMLEKVEERLLVGGESFYAAPGTFVVVLGKCMVREGVYKECYFNEEEDSVQISAVEDCRLVSFLVKSLPN